MSWKEKKTFENTKILKQTGAEGGGGIKEGNGEEKNREENVNELIQSRGDEREASEVVEEETTLYPVKGTKSFS